MKTLPQLLSIFLILIVSCNDEKENLDFPKSIDKIEEVTLSRPDKKSNGKFAEQKKLSEQEIKELLKAISKSKPIGPTKFNPDYFIVFKTKEGKTKRLRVNGKTLKGYENDFSYNFNPPLFLYGF